MVRSCVGEGKSGRSGDSPPITMVQTRPRWLSRSAPGDYLPLVRGDQRRHLAFATLERTLYCVLIPTKVPKCRKSDLVITADILAASLSSLSCCPRRPYTRAAVGTAAVRIVVEGSTTEASLEAGDRAAWASRRRVVVAGDSGAGDG